MNQEVKDKWVAALRSGEYTQVTRRLRRDERGPKCMCALGVLVDVVEGWADQAAGGGLATLTPAVLKKTGLPKRAAFGPELLYLGAAHTVVALNDLEGLSFDHIADLLEAS